MEGLKEEIRHTVKMLNPFSLSQALDKARHQENLLSALSWEEKELWNKSTTSNYQQNTRGRGLSIGNTRNRLFETRRAHGLCYKYRDKYQPGHQCKHKLNVISATTEQHEMVPIGETEVDIMNYDVEPVEEPIDEAICLNALSGTEVPNTILLRGEAKRNGITIPLNSRSTHSFLDLETAQKLGCTINDAFPMRVIVASGIIFLVSTLVQS